MTRQAHGVDSSDVSLRLAKLRTHSLVMPSIHLDSQVCTSARSLQVLQHRYDKVGCENPCSGAR